MVKKKLITTRHRVDLRSLNYSSLTHAIEELQSVADRPDCDPDEATVELEHSHGYYDEIDTYINVSWQRTREETDKERQKRLDANRKSRETKKKNKELSVQRDIELRDKLLKKYPV